jgi:ElaB/YqjD/DUF883 family membrane-anchored ribosome-binding protein
MEPHVEHAVDTTFGSAERVKVQTADALDEAARKLRDMSMTATGEDIKAVLNEAGVKIDKLKADVGHKVEPVEDFISEHPFMSIAIAAGAGILIGALLVRRD